MTVSSAADAVIAPPPLAVLILGSWWNRGRSTLSQYRHPHRGRDRHHHVFADDVLLLW